MSSIPHVHRQQRQRRKTDDMHPEGEQTMEQAKNPNCPICYDPMDPFDTVTLPCRHTTHTECALKWLKISYHGDCSMCRAPISELELTAQERRHARSELERLLVPGVCVHPNWLPPLPDNLGDEGDYANGNDDDSESGDSDPGGSGGAPLAQNLDSNAAAQQMVPMNYGVPDLMYLQPPVPGMPPGYYNGFGNMGMAGYPYYMDPMSSGVYNPAGQFGGPLNGPMANYSNGYQHGPGQMGMPMGPMGGQSYAQPTTSSRGRSRYGNAGMQMGRGSYAQPTTSPRGRGQSGHRARGRNSYAQPTSPRGHNQFGNMAMAMSRVSYALQTSSPRSRGRSRSGSMGMQMGRGSHAHPLSPGNHNQPGPPGLSWEQMMQNPPYGNPNNNNNVPGQTGMSRGSYAQPPMGPRSHNQLGPAVMPWERSSTRINPNHLPSRCSIMFGSMRGAATIAWDPEPTTESTGSNASGPGQMGRGGNTSAPQPGPSQSQQRAAQEEPSELEPDELDEAPVGSPRRRPSRHPPREEPKTPRGGSSGEGGRA